MKIAFRVDAGQDGGSWRLSRCLALASGLKESEPSAEISFFSRAPGRAQEISSAGFSHVPFSELAMPSWDMEATAEKAEELGISLMVLDRPSADEDFLEALQAKTTLAVFDDSMRLGSYSAHAIINPGPHAHLLEYPLGEQTELFLGTEFAPLPPEFDGFQDFRCANPGRARHILVYFRGTDYSVEAVRLLKSAGGQFSATVLSSDPARGEELAREIGIDSRFLVLHGQAGIARRLSSCDLALTGPETFCEPAFFSLPTALIGESPASDYAAMNGLALSLGSASGLDSGGAAALERFISEKEARDRMSARLSELVDGLGRFRLAEGLLKALPSQQAPLL